MSRLNDQPLYSKAVDIVLAEKLNVAVTLGGFHTLMNFMGAIGHIMRGSGLESALECIFSKSTIQHIMTGKAYARGIRAHLLIQTALVNIMLCHILPDEEKSETQSGLPDDVGIQLTEEDIAELRAVFKKAWEQKVCISQWAETDSTEDDMALMPEKSLIDNGGLAALESSLRELGNVLKSQSRTAKLWLQYLHHIEILKAFIAAEQTSNWKMHLSASEAMLPVFAAAQHTNYARSGRVYLQQMQHLPSVHPWLYNKFQDDLFTIHQSEQLWSGLSPDLVIEQDMMAEIKRRGGLTRGRGMTTRITWFNTLIQSTAVIAQLSKLTGVVSCSKQHVEVTRARMKRDFTSVDKLIEFFSTNKQSLPLC